MFFTKKHIIPFFITIFFSFLIYLLISKQLIYLAIPAMVKNGASHIFADWSVILSANICKSKFDVFLSNPCDVFNRTHVYGEILLYFPLIKEFSKFYIFILPTLLNFIFIYVVIRFFNHKNYLEYLIIIPMIFSTPVLLVIERANIDIIIFLFILLIAINKNIIFNYIFILLITLSKFYPVCLAIIFLYEKNIKKILINSIIFALIIACLLYFQFDEIKKIFTLGSDASAGRYLSFSLIGSINHFDDLNIIYNNKNYNWIKYLYIFIFLIIPIIITVIYSKNFIFKSNEIKSLFLKNKYENRLYILSSTVIIVCYLSFENFLYREIFLLGLVPWILKEREELYSSSFLNFYFYTLCLKFFVTTILIYLYRNYLEILKPLAIITKHCFDFYIIFILLLVFFSALSSLIKELNYKKKNFYT